MNLIYGLGKAMYINTTNKCTNRYIFCSRTHDDYNFKGIDLRLESDPSPAETIKIIEEQGMDGIEEIVFCGFGEPLLRPEFVAEVAKWIKTKYPDKKIRVNTNGLARLALNRDVISIVASFVDSFSISLNASNEDQYNKLCQPIFGKKAYNEIISFIEDSKNMLSEVKVTYVGIEGVSEESMNYFSFKVNKREMNAGKATKLNMSVGQTDLRPEVKAVLAQPIQTPAYFSEYKDLEVATKNMIKKILNQKSGEVTLKVGTGTLGLESVVYSAVRKGDTVLIFDQGHWSNFLGNLCETYGAKVIIRKINPGDCVRKEYVQDELEKHPEINFIAMVHNETNTGVLNPLEEISDLVKEKNCYLFVDAMSSFGGVKIDFSGWNIDFLVTIGQKCLNAPQGTPIIALSERALSLIESRKNEIKSNTLDVRINRPSYLLTRSLNAALKVVADDEEPTYMKHIIASKALREGIRAMGLKVFADESCASPTCTRIVWPDEIAKNIEADRKAGIDKDRITRYMLEHENVVFGEDRFGTMGYFATKKNILTVIEALGKTLLHFNFECDVSSAKMCVEAVYNDK